MERTLSPQDRNPKNAKILRFTDGCFSAFPFTIMNNLAKNWTLSALFVLCAGLNHRAQEVTFMGGILPGSKLERSSYAWQVDYSQDLYRNLATSIAYINEGHLREHHRDGTAWQLWGRLPFDKNRFAISLGVGAYYFYDTQPLPVGGTANIHGTAPIYSLSATGYLSNRWFYRFNFNRIDPANQIKVNTMTVGAGFWFGQDKKPTPGELGDAANEEAYVTENELTVFTGQSVVNTFGNPKSRAFAGEYRRGIFPHVDWTASAIYEGAPQVVRRSGAATQVWAVNSFFDNRVTVGAGLGPYIYLDKKHPSTPDKKSPAAIAPLVSLTVSTRLSENCTIRLVFDRVTTNYNRDADIFLIGFGFRWPR